MIKVLIADKMAHGATKMLKDRGIHVDVITGLAPDELKEIIGNYEGITIRSSTKITADILDAASNLKVIGRAGIGVDNIDVSSATSRGIVVMNTPFGNSITTAEHTISMIMSLARHIPQANHSTHEGKWEKSKFMGVELFGKTLGVIGAGNIGRIVIDRAIGLKMHVIIFDPFLSENSAFEMGVQKVNFDELLSKSHFITLHTPLTDKTRNIINQEALSKMQKGVFIINCARGGLVVESDLKAAIESGHVAGAALDVFSDEPSYDNPLFGMKQVICTPHLGASTLEAQDNVALQVAEQLANMLQNGVIENSLNVPSMSADEIPYLRQYINLAQLIASFSGQITKSSIQSVTCELQGEVTSLKNTSAIKVAVLEGLLKHMVAFVNQVNAPYLAKERKIEYKEVKSDKKINYQSMISLTLQTQNQTRTISGTIVHGSVPRIIAINGVKVEIDFSGNMLFIINVDKPGFVGASGSLLGKAGINIRNLVLSQCTDKGEAICVIQVDEPIDESIINSLRDLPHTKTVHQLSF